MEINNNHNGDFRRSRTSWWKSLFKDLESRIIKKKNKKMLESIKYNY